MRKIVIIIIGFAFFVQLNAQQSTTGKHRPENVSKGITLKYGTNQITINDVPSYLWRYGCGPTALGMVIGYYDRQGFSDLINGDSYTQTNEVNNSMANSEHYNDYSLPKDYSPNLLEDKSETGDAHTSNCIADFMQTSWSSAGNYWGWSYSSKIDDAFTKYIRMKNFAYEINTSYEWFSESSWDKYLTEINNDRPVVLLVDSDGDGGTDHFVTGFGYDDTDTTYAIYDTWNHEIHWYKWREMADDYSWGIYGFNILEISINDADFKISASVNPNNSGTINGAGAYDNGETCNLTASEENGYYFVNWTEDDIEVSTGVNYSFTVSEERTLVANFINCSSSAGEDLFSCGAEATLNAEEPVNGTGIWSVFTGQGTFVNNSMAKTKVIDIPGGDNEYIWTVNNNGCSDSDTVLVTFREFPSANFSVSPINQTYPSSTVNIENLSQSTFEFYKWDFGDENTVENNSFIANFSHIYSSWGDYEITLIGGYISCADTTRQNVKILEATTGLQSLLQNGIKIYPNPSNGIFSVEFENNSLPDEITITGLNGQKVYHNTKLNKHQIIDLSTFGLGIYFIRINTANETIVAKVIISK